MNFKTGASGFIYTSLVGRLGLGAWLCMGPYRVSR